MDNLYFGSPLLNHAGKELDWFQGDSLELFVHNLKTRKSELIKYNWQFTKITYRINSLGFRGEEFNNSSSAIFLGCSQTFGIGLPVENVWPSIVSNYLNLQCINLAIGAGSNDLAFRMSYYHIPKTKPKIVFMLSPEPSRLEVVDEHDHPHRLNVQSKNMYHNKDWNIFYYDWIMSNTNIFLNREKNIMSISKICRDNGIKFACLNVEDIKNLDLARDLSHFGRLTNQSVAEQFLNLI